MKLSSYLIPHTSHIHASRRGFTIVETLIAIAILMIAIAGPLVVASKGLNSALYAKDQMIASFLAQETMEAVKNKRDNNIAAGRDWLDGFPMQCSVNPQVCIIDLEGIASNFNPTSNSEGARVYHNSSSGYSYDTGDPSTIFKRYFKIEESTIDSDKQVTVSVFVDWYEHSIPFQIMLQSQMTNAVR